MGIRNKVTGEFYSIATYDPSTGNVTGINTVGGTTDLGDVTGVFIGGGNPGEVLSTDGTGNLFWIPDASATPAGASSQLQYNDGGAFAASANLTFSDSVAGGVVEVGTELTLLGNGTIGTAGADLLLQPAGNLVAEVAGNDWTFDITGNLTIPGTSGGFIKTVANASIGIAAMDDGTDNPAQMMSWNVGSANPTTIISAYADNARIQTDVLGALNTWTFEANGVTVFPGDLIGSGASPAPSINGFDSANFVGNVTADYFIGNGSQLTSIAGANVTGTVTSATVAASANSVAGANVSGQVANALVAGTVYTAEQPNITSVGTLSNLTVSGNVTADLLIGDGGYLSNIAGGNVVGEVALANTVSNPSQPNITSVGTLVSLTTGSLNTTGLFTANGNAQFNQDVYFAGNVTLPGTINQISGNSASFFGDPATGFGALYVGIPAGYTILDNEVAQFADNFDGYTQITHQNLNGGDQATGDFVITADNGTDLVNYIDLGMAGSGYDGTLANNSLGTALYPNDGYLYTQGNVTGGNLVIGSNQTNGVVRIIANGASNIGDVVATFAANGLTVASNVAASYFLGNGSQLTSIAGSSVTGIVASASVASVANSIAAENVSGQVANALVAGTVYTNAQPNITSVGTLVDLTVSGNVTADYFLGNGSQLTGVVQTTDKPNNLLYVAKNGNDSTGSGSINTPYLTVQNAINTAAAANIATTIVLAPGNYSENLTIANIPNALNITGSGLSESTINGNIAISGTSNNIEFDNFRVSTGRVTHSATGYWSVLNMRFSANTGITKTSTSTTKIFNTDLGAAGTGSVLLQAGKTNIYNCQVFNAQISGASTEVNFLQCDTVILPTVASGNVNFIDSIIVSSGTGNSLNAVGGTVTLKNTLSITPTRALAPINFGAGSSYSYGASAFDYANTTFAGTAIVQQAQFQAINVRGNVTATGNVIAAYVIGDGSQLTNLPQPVPAIGTIASGANIAPTTAVTQYNVTALAVASNVDAPTGTPTDGQKLTIRILDNGTPQALTWDAVYEVIGTTLPTTTVANKFVYVGCIYNAQSSKWDVVSVATQA